MKKILLYSILFFLSHSVSAQDGNRIEALKIAYITKKLDLSPEEAQRFWPIYNQYASEIQNARRDANNNGKSEIDLEESVLNIRKKYNGQFNKALSPEKANTFFRSEKEFGNFVQKEMERRQLKMQQRRSMMRP